MNRRSWQWFQGGGYLLLLWMSGVIPLSAAAPDEILPPLGPHIFLTEADFHGSQSMASSNRLVCTSYFYWYDAYSDAHLVNADGTDALTHHPPTTTGFSYKSKAWHKAQLRDMMAAGIDFLLPVYWGAPSERLPGKALSEQSWSYAGLLPLVEAREELLTEGQVPPRLGLFYDTSTLQFNAWNQHVDLTTSYGRRWFYESVRDYFSLIPPKHWMLLDGKPVIFLYSANFAQRHDQSSIDYLRTNFAREFGGRSPYVVREISWQVQSEQVYAWGGALGLKNPGVASLGPGYDHSAVPGRTPLVVQRENGQFFARNWESFLRRPSNLVTIETWNEYHEGTDIAASKEFGRQYIDLNRKYVDMFKAGIVPPRPVGAFSGARSIGIELGATNRENGLHQFDWADGTTAPATVAGSDCRGVRPNPNLGHYIYFKVDDGFKWDRKMNVAVAVEYYDAAPGGLTLEFDGSDPRAPFAGAYSANPTSVQLAGTKTWKSAGFTLTDAVFLNSQNGGADFRLNVTTSEFYVRKVQVIRPGLTAGTFTPGQGFRLNLHGEPNHRYAIETSSNLIDWRAILLLRPQVCPEAFLDVDSPGQFRRWYRARAAP